MNKLLPCDPVTTVKLFEHHSDAPHTEMDNIMIQTTQTDLVITSAKHELIKDLDVNAILQKQAEDHGRKNNHNYNLNNHHNQMNMMNYQMYQRMNMIVVNVIYVMMKVRWHSPTLQCTECGKKCHMFCEPVIKFGGDLVYAARLLGSVELHFENKGQGKKKNQKAM